MDTTPRTRATAAAARPTSVDEAMMVLLHEKVPLSLLLDLTAASGPTSEEILANEGAPEDAWWEPRR